MIRHSKLLQTTQTCSAFQIMLFPYLHLFAGPFPMRPLPAAPPFVAAPALPVSESSPFTQLAPGPSPVSNTSEYTTFWRCGDTVINSAVYHSLNLAIENGFCDNQTLTSGLYDCGAYSITPATYTALLTGLNQFSKEELESGF